MTENELKCCVSGSFFKFKPEIDETIDEFQGLNVVVLSPDKGWLYIPRHITTSEELIFRPLPSERGMPQAQIEDEFLKCVRKSDFLYVENPEGYAGEMVCLEIGFAMGCGILVFSREPIKSEELNDLRFKEIVDQIKIADPEDVKALLKAGKEGTT